MSTNIEISLVQMAKIVAHLNEQLIERESEIESLKQRLHEWWIDRNSLSSDCQLLGISSSSEDSGKWGQELAKRCEPLRKFCDELFREEKS